MIVKFTIPFELLDLNGIIDLAHKRTGKYCPYNEIKRDTEIRIIYELRRQKVKPIPAESLPVGFEYTWFCKDKRKNPDNISVGRKFVLDALVKAKIIPNDGWNEVWRQSDLFIVDKDRQGVEVLIRGRSS